jgi:phosphoribosylglycinamide formyltransferase-1
MALPIAVLASGTGSNLDAILQAIDAEQCQARVAVVVSDRNSAGALLLARGRAIPAHVVRLKDFATRELWDEALADVVCSHGPALVVLAGFMKLLGAQMLSRFAGRIINVHPALLPLFPGTDAPAQAIAAGVRLSGCSVHVVDGGLDSGPIIAQAAVPLLPDDDAERLHRRIQQAEHRLLPAVVDAVARGDIELGELLRIDPTQFAPDAILFSPAIART